MAKAKAQAIKFAHTDKKRVRGKKGHTRTAGDDKTIVKPGYGRTSPPKHRRTTE